MPEDVLFAAASAAADYDVTYAQIAGTIATILFSIQYLPQTFLNYKRKSVAGFSTSGIIIKLIGSCFLVINAWVSGETWPVVLYGLCNTIQHSIFCIQFSMYKNNPNYSLWLFFLLVPATLCAVFPASMVFTNSIKPITQIISHFPQLQECWSVKTTGGVSLMSQSFNLIGGVLGIYMCWVIPAKSSMTILLYINSVFQAVSLFALFFLFDYGRSGHVKQRDPTDPITHEKATVYDWWAALQGGGGDGGDGYHHNDNTHRPPPPSSLQSSSSSSSSSSLSLSPALLI